MAMRRIRDTVLSWQVLKCYRVDAREVVEEEPWQVFRPSDVMYTPVPCIGIDRLRYRSIASVLSNVRVTLSSRQGVEVDSTFSE